MIDGIREVMDPQHASTATSEESDTEVDVDGDVLCSDNPVTPQASKISFSISRLLDDRHVSTDASGCDPSPDSSPSPSSPIHSGPGFMAPAVTLHSAASGALAPGVIRVPAHRLPGLTPAAAAMGLAPPPHPSLLMSPQHWFGPAAMAAALSPFQRSAAATAASLASIGLIRDRFAGQF